jgi:hypothetical protein
LCTITALSKVLMLFDIAPSSKLSCISH